MKQKLPAGRITPSWTAGWRHHSSSISPLQVTNLLLLLCRNVCSHMLAPEAVSLQSPFCPAPRALLGWPPSRLPGRREGAHVLVGVWPRVAWMGSSPSQGPPSCRGGEEVSAQGKRELGPVGREQTSLLEGVVRIRHCPPARAALQAPCKALLLPASSHPPNSAPIATWPFSSPLLYNNGINNNEHFALVFFPLGVTKRNGRAWERIYVNVKDFSSGGWSWSVN